MKPGGDYHALIEALRGAAANPVEPVAATWGYNTGGLFGTTAPNSINDNSRFSVHKQGDGYGIWDINSGGFTSVHGTEREAKGIAQWQNYLNSKMPKY